MLGTCLNESNIYSIQKNKFKTFHYKKPSHKFKLNSGKRREYTMYGRIYFVCLEHRLIYVRLSLGSTLSSLGIFKDNRNFLWKHKVTYC